MEVVRIRKAILEEMIRHARQDAPLECCGLLLGEDDVITDLRKMKNVSQSEVRYSIDPQALFHFFKELRLLRQKHLGIYHSHPVSEAYPSSIDVEQAFYPDCSYLISSLTNSRSPSVRAFAIQDYTVLEKEIRVVE